MLRIQNKNLSERLVQRQKLESELREKIQRLQNRKVDDDNKLCLIDRFWTQLDEDLRIIMERFDSESINQSENSNKSKQNSSGNGQESSGSSSTGGGNKSSAGSSQAVRKFLAKLNDWDKEEIEELLVERVKFTTQTVAKLVLNYDRYILTRFFRILHHISKNYEKKIHLRKTFLTESDIQFFEISKLE